MALINKTFSVSKLSLETKKDMFQLFSQYYTDTNEEMFISDLDKKSHVFTFWDKSFTPNKLAGFSTIDKQNACPTLKSNALSLYSGDTVLASEYWGSKILQKAFFWYILKSKLLSPLKPVYWMLISKGFKTYMLMRKNFPASYPNRHEDAPSEMQLFKNSFYKNKFSHNYSSSNSKIIFAEPKGAVKDGVSEPSNYDKQNLDIQYFIEANPNFRTGEELACIAEIRFKDLSFHFGKYFLKIFFKKSKARKLQTNKI